jgi:sterol desaturase/sphingolipid hydroxylase (fatty acid hydroxylase superfamily)
MEEIRHLEPHIRSFGTDIARLIIWLMLLAAIFVPMERFFALKNQRTLRPEFFIDLGYYFINNLVPKFVLILPVAILAWGLHFIVPSGLDQYVAELPLTLRFPAAMIVGELGFYWGHRWSHSIPFLWRFHAIHHSAVHVDWLVNTRAHPVDIVFTRLCGFIPMYVLGLARPITNTLDVVPLLVLVVGSMWGFFIHANVRWHLCWLGWLVSTPAFHHWHHTNDSHRDNNYASMLPVFDRVFGTLHLPERQWPAKYGIDMPIAATLAGQLMQPLGRNSNPGLIDNTSRTPERV